MNRTARQSGSGTVLRRRLGGVWGVAWLTIAVCLLPLATPAATIVVSTLDGGVTADPLCSLHEAIIAANTDSAYHGCPAGSGEDTVSIPIEGTINLSSALPDIVDDIHVVGPGPGLTIAGATGIRPFKVVGDGATGVEIAHLNIAFGHPVASGGAIASSGANLLLRHLNVSFNSVDAGDGGAVVVTPSGSAFTPDETGSLRVEDCTFAYNSAHAGDSEASGGAIASSVPATILRSVFTDNSAATSGGALSTDDPNLSVKDCVFESNSAFVAGALSYLSPPFSSGQLTVRRTLFRSNSSQQQGGAISLDGGLVAIAVISASTFAENTTGGGLFLGPGGGAIALLGESMLSATNCTFDHNDAGSGTALYLGDLAYLKLSHCTLADNDSISPDPGVIWTGATTIVEIEASIVVGSDAVCRGDGSFVSNGYNILSSATCGGGPHDSVVLGGAALEPLADNGGPVPTRLPGATSSAVDTGAPVAPQADEVGCLATDARGLSRPRDGATGAPGGSCDRGAVERAPGLIFLDGFEGGSPWLWSNQVP